MEGILTSYWRRNTTQHNRMDPCVLQGPGRERTSFRLTAGWREAGPAGGNPSQLCMECTGISLHFSALPRYLSYTRINISSGDSFPATLGRNYVFSSGTLTFGNVTKTSPN